MSNWRKHKDHVNYWWMFFGKPGTILRYYPDTNSFALWVNMADGELKFVASFNRASMEEAMTRLEESDDTR
jgi:hypothetical protein